MLLFRQDLKAGRESYARGLFAQEGLSHPYEKKRLAWHGGGRSMPPPELALRGLRQARQQLRVAALKLHNAPD
jgi:hypothetical protein